MQDKRSLPEFWVCSVSVLWSFAIIQTFFAKQHCIYSNIGDWMRKWPNACVNFRSRLKNESCMASSWRLHAYIYIWCVSDFYLIATITTTVAVVSMPQSLAQLCWAWVGRMLFLNISYAHTSKLAFCALSSLVEKLSVGGSCSVEYCNSKLQG